MGKPIVYNVDADRGLYLTEGNLVNFVSWYYHTQPGKCHLVHKITYKESVIQSLQDKSEWQAIKCQIDWLIREHKIPTTFEIIYHKTSIDDLKALVLHFNKNYNTINTSHIKTIYM